MPTIISISLGSSARNYRAEAIFRDENFIIERIGTDGSMELLAHLIRKNDGLADVITVGGLNQYYVVDDYLIPFKESKSIYHLNKKTPVVDGYFFRKWVEPEFVRELFESGVIKKQAQVFFPLVSNRFEMADAFSASGAKAVLMGDLIYDIGLPFGMMRSIPLMKKLSRLVAPLISLIPFTWLYPTGEKQEEIREKEPRFYRESDVIAGDFHNIRRFLINDLAGKTIVTNTVTSQDRQLLKERGLKTLVTLSPNFSGRTFGSNVIHGILLYFFNKEGAHMDRDSYLALIRELGISPVIENLN